MPVISAVFKSWVWALKGRLENALGDGDDVAGLDLESGDALVLGHRFRVELEDVLLAVALAAHGDLRRVGDARVAAGHRDGVEQRDALPLGHVVAAGLV